VSPKKQSIVVPRAVDTGVASGNYTFVRVSVYRKGSKAVGGSPGKWIQAPITVGCTAAAQDRLTVGDYNLRTWAGDKTNDVQKCRCVARTRSPRSCAAALACSRSRRRAAR
jgi:hypothetical protein